MGSGRQNVNSRFPGSKRNSDRTGGTCDGCGISTNGTLFSASAVSHHDVLFIGRGVVGWWRENLNVYRREKERKRDRDV